MGVTRHPYDVPGWGVGEVWALDGLIVQHELASDGLGSSPEPARLGAGAPPRHTDGAGDGEGPAGDMSPAASPTGGARLPARTLPPDPSPVRDTSVSDLCRRIAEHLAGIPTSYEGIAIDLDWATPLQQELATAAREIPWGEVVSYGELATLAGRPRAARAAGSFCAENRFSLIIPCHRVVAANGIGGYGEAGPQVKRRLLALEGVRL